MSAIVYFEGGLCGEEEVGGSVVDVAIPLREERQGIRSTVVRNQFAAVWLSKYSSRRGLEGSKVAVRQREAEPQLVEGQFVLGNALVFCIREIAGLQMRYCLYRERECRNRIDCRNS